MTILPNIADVLTTFMVEDDCFQNYVFLIMFYHFNTSFTMNQWLALRLRESHFRMPVQHDLWITHYLDVDFYNLFRMQRASFEKLLTLIITHDQHQIIIKRHLGGNIPVVADKALMIFLRYMASKETLHSIGETFNVVPSTVMHIINAFAYVISTVKTKYIFWPQTQEEFQYISEGFRSYPGTIGAVDGSHVEIKVPVNQQDSYINRYLSHSINLMAISTSQKIFTYVFVGFPGSAHDSRVFSNSYFAREIVTNGPTKYFLNSNYHLIGDSAFPIRSWLMTPFKNPTTRTEKRHNYCLSAARVAVENIFGLLKGRWARLQFINVYSISKAVEIVTTACILHNFLYLHNDGWTGEVYEEEMDQHLPYADIDNLQDRQIGIRKRMRIAESL